MAVQATWNEKTTFKVGDTIKINYKIAEGGKKERIQPFQGIVVSIKGSGDSKTFTVRKIASDKIGVERIFPLNSPWADKIEVVREPRRRIRRAKLYYLRDSRSRKKKGKRAV